MERVTRERQAEVDTLRAASAQSLWEAMRTEFDTVKARYWVDVPHAHWPDAPHSDKYERYAITNKRVRGSQREVHLVRVEATAEERAMLSPYVETHATTGRPLCLLRPQRLQAELWWADHLLHLLTCDADAARRRGVGNARQLELSVLVAALVVRAGFFEIYRGKCFDLLARKRKIEVMEDERGQQCLVGLSWVDLPSADALLQLLANTQRTTRATAQNEQSSRSHAILQIAVCVPAAQAWQASEERCKLSLVDLAGSEWAAKAQSDDRGNRLDGAEINKSLLCLKECIRALGSHGSHVPFRGSKLTQVLKDSFVGAHTRTVMIANISPSSLCCEHSLNTLRYAERVKDWQVPC